MDQDVTKSLLIVSVHSVKEIGGDVIQSNVEFKFLNVRSLFWIYI